MFGTPFSQSSRGLLENGTWVSSRPHPSCSVSKRCFVLCVYGYVYVCVYT